MQDLDSAYRMVRFKLANQKVDTGKYCHTLQSRPSQKVL